jgi:TPR repeat protein
MKFTSVRDQIVGNPQREAEAIELYIRYLEVKQTGNREGAERFLRASAELGEPMALHEVALNEARMDVAVPLYTAAADAGYAASAWNLYLHFDSSGDRAQAARWLMRAASLGDQDAVRLLGQNAPE